MFRQKRLHVWLTEIYFSVILKLVCDVFNYICYTYVMMKLQFCTFKIY